MSIVSNLFFYSALMAILSFLAGLPSFWIVSKSQAALPLMLQLTSGLLLSTAIVIVLPEAVSNLSSEDLHSNFFGPQILLGFVLLYSIDTLSKNYKLQNNYENDNSIDIIDNFENDAAGIDFDINLFHYNQKKNNLKYLMSSAMTNSTTLGLLLHCITDGIILTCTLLSNNNGSDHGNDVEEKPGIFMIILALFVHKIPASFSLTSVLLNQQLDKFEVLFHLLLFSLSAPVAAWLAFIIYNLLNISTDQISNSFILLFSAGAFLYVSFHTFISCHEHNDPDLNGRKTFFANWGFFASIIGMIIPIMVSFLHDE